MNGLEVLALTLAVLAGGLAYAGVLKVELKRPTPSQRRRTTRKQTQTQTPPKPGGADDYDHPGYTVDETPF